MKKFLNYFLLSLLIIFPSVQLQAQVDVTLPDTTAKSNTFIYIPIKVSDLTGKDVKSYNFKVSFNGRILKSEGISVTNSLTNKFTWETETTKGKSYIKVEASGVFALNGAGTLIFLKFSVIGDSGSSNLVFKSFVFNSGVPAVVKHNGKFTVYVEKWLKIKKIGSGKGIISVNDIDYKLPYEKLLQTGKTYKLLAKPNTNSKFISWEGDIISSDNPYYLEFNNEMNIDVKFVIKKFNITLEKEPVNGGEVSGEGKYNYNQNITIKATPAENWEFINWKEGETIVSEMPSYSFVVKNDRTLKANFSKKKITIIGNVEPLNSGTILGLGKYEIGTTVMLTARPNAGWSFLEWRYSNGDTVISNNPILSVVVQNNMDLIAKFSKNLYSVLTTSNPKEGGIASGGGYFYYGQEAELIAVPNTGWEFENWTLNGNIIGEKENIKINVNANMNIAANYRRILYSLTISPEPIEGGIINGGGFYYYNQTATVTAVPNEGWKFDNWTLNYSIVNTEMTYDFIVTDNTNLKGNFSLITDISEQNNKFDNDFISSPFPNPFNPTTTFHFGIKSGAVVNLYIYNITGKLIKKLINNQYFPEGIYNKTLFAQNLPSGVYFYQFTSLDKISDNNLYKSGKILLLK